MQLFRNILPTRLKHFLEQEQTGGLVMILSALLAIIVANSAISSWYRDIIIHPIAGLPFDMFVKDVLMIFFFLLIGMELKREMIDGVLADKKQILLPFIAAIGGMAIPAVIFLIIAPEYASGWAIPSATDIAFAVCILMLVGSHIQPSLKIFLLAIAIFDDLGAILIIAFFYSSGVVVAPLITAGFITAGLIAMNRLRVTNIISYLVLGGVLAIALHEAGIHTTLAGVIVGLAIPYKDPLERFMHALHPWVAFFILPLFAFTASGVNLSEFNMDALTAPLPLAVMLGLFLGKQIGIFGTSFALIKLGLAKSPHGAGWRQIYGVSIIAGIGFTMSLFITLLAFDDVILQEQAKIGVIAGSLLATLWGWLVLRKSS